MESAGLSASAYGPDSRQQVRRATQSGGKFQNPVRLLGNFNEYMNRAWTDMSTPLVSLAHEADLIVTGTIIQIAANVAEYYDIPFAAVHPSPVRTGSGSFFRWCRHHSPASRCRQRRWLYLAETKPAQDAQREGAALNEDHWPPMATH